MLVQPPRRIENRDISQALKNRGLMKDRGMSFCAGAFSEKYPARHLYSTVTACSYRHATGNNLVMAIGAIIEHFHPHAVDAPSDADSSMLARRLA